MQQPHANRPAPVSRWWEPVSIKQGQCWHYAIGPLQLYLQRGNEQWLLAWEQAAGTENDHKLSSGEIEAMPCGLPAARYVFKNPPTDFCLTPRLLERPVVVKTHQPVHVPPGERMVFYISSPVCVTVALSPSAVVLQEIPTLRLSDTWFGPSTLIGELCYADKTQARNSRAEVPLRPHRAVTPITIHNSSKELLTIEKLSIPVPYLSVYGLTDGTLWTDSVLLEHTEAGQLATLKITKDLPEGVSAGDLLTEARLVLQKGSLVRAFASMFSD
ncbi:MAG TPA: DUF432 domain-containing protein [Cellvibrionaceae bacterium]